MSEARASKVRASECAVQSECVVSKPSPHSKQAAPAPGRPPVLHARPGRLQQLRGALMRRVQDLPRQRPQQRQQRGPAGCARAVAARAEESGEAGQEHLAHVHRGPAGGEGLRGGRGPRGEGGEVRAGQDRARAGQGQGWAGTRQGQGMGQGWVREGGLACHVSAALRHRQAAQGQAVCAMQLRQHSRCIDTATALTQQLH